MIEKIGFDSAEVKKYSESDIAEIIEYRDTLAERLNEIRNADPKDPVGSRERAKNELIEFQKSTEYKIYEEAYRDIIGKEMKRREAELGKTKSVELPAYKTAAEYFEEIGLKLELGPAISSMDTEEEYYSGTYYSAKSSIERMNKNASSGDNQWRLPTREEAESIVARVKKANDNLKEAKKEKKSEQDVKNAREEWESAVFEVNKIFGTNISGQFWTSSEIGGGFVAAANTSTGKITGVEASLWDGQSRPLDAFVVKDIGSRGK